jgi:hypothetical protein
MREDKYKIDKDGIISPCPDIEEWGRFMNDGDLRRVERTKMDSGTEISTVFLALDHSFGGDTPILFETMVFGGELDQSCERYSTIEQAKAGHWKTVDRVRIEEDQKPIDEITSRILEID